MVACQVAERGDAGGIVQVGEGLEGLRSRVLRFLRERDRLEEPGSLGCGRTAFPQGFDRFDDSMKFETTQTATQTEWSTWTITLQPVVGGNAPTTEVDPPGTEIAA